MARPLRPNIADGIYHVMGRGIDRSAIYVDTKDRERFLKAFAGVVHRYGWECLAYCLMGNHYHLVIRTPRPNLSRGMGLATGAYASWFNARHNRVGHVFQGRFRSRLIRSSADLRFAIRYVLVNPVVAGLCEHPEEWRWSSYKATLDDHPNGLLAARATLTWFGNDGGDGREHFVRFITADDTELIVGSWMDDVALPCEPVAPAPRPPLAELLGVRPGGREIALAHGRHGYSLTEIATALSRSTSAVGRTLVAHESEQMLTASTWPHRAG